MMSGVTYGEACEELLASEGEQAIELAGSMLRRWLYEGLVDRLA